MLQISPDQDTGTSNWSPAFPIDVLGSHVLPVLHPVHRRIVFIRAEVQITPSGVISIAFSSVPEEETPYKFENDTPFWVQYKQHGVQGMNRGIAADDWEWLAPGSQARYNPRFYWFYYHI